jgi:hypothetical protein
MGDLEMFGDAVELAAPDIGAQFGRDAGVAATRISSSEEAIFTARRMICHGAASRCMTSDSANGRTCGAVSVGTFNALFTEAIWESPKLRSTLGSLPAKPSSCSRAFSTAPMDGRSSTAWVGPMRAAPRLPDVTAAMAAAAACWNFLMARSMSEAPGSGDAMTTASNSRTASEASRSSHCQIGSREARRI